MTEGREGGRGVINWFLWGGLGRLEGVIGLGLGRAGRGVGNYPGCVSEWI